MGGIESITFAKTSFDELCGDAGGNDNDEGTNV
jgi:hypothetical protein